MHPTHKSLCTIISLSFLLACTTKQESNNHTSHKHWRDTIDLKAHKSNINRYEMPQTFSDTSIFEYGTIRPGSKTYSYDSITTLYKDSLLKTPYSFQITKNDEIHICYFLNTKTIINSYSNNIYYVQIQKTGQTYFGYMAENQLALVWQKIDPDYSIYLSIRQFHTINGIKQIQANISLYQKQTWVNQIIFEPAYQPENGLDTLDYYYCLSSFMVKKSKLNKIKTMITIDSFYPACGYNSGESMLLFDGQKIYFGLTTSNYYDAGIVADYTTIDTPTDTTLAPTHLYMTTNHIEYDESGNKGTVHDSTIIDYEWTNTNQLYLKDTIAHFKNK